MLQGVLARTHTKHSALVIACIVTHYHDDRTGGLRFLRLQGIPTYSSRQTAELCRVHAEHEAENWFTRDTTFVFGSNRIETFYPGEGHTKDNIVLWCPDAQVLYGGCLVKSRENMGLGNVADANVHAWPATIRRLINMYTNASFVVPGHFSWSSREALQHTLRLLRHK